MRYQSLLIQAVFNQDKDSPEKSLNNTQQENELSSKLITKPFNDNSVNTSADSSSMQVNTQNALSVYRNNYIMSGIGALSITYSTVFAMMDEEDFRKLSLAYLKAYPKTCFDWADYGQGLSEFMLSIDALTSMPFLPELADIDWRLMQIERASSRAFDAASFSLLQTKPPETLRFLPGIGLQLTEALFPVQELYELAHTYEDECLSHSAQVQKQTSSNKVQGLISSAIKKPTYRSIVLWRQHYKGLFEYCDEATSNAFRSMLSNNSVSDVLSHFGDDQSGMSRWLQQSIASKKVCAIVIRARSL